MKRPQKLESFLKSVVKYNEHEKFIFIFYRAKQNKDERLFLYDFIKKEYNLNETFDKEELDIFFNNKSLSILDCAISNPYDGDLDFWKFLHYKNSLKEEDKKSFGIVKKFIKTFNTYHNIFELSEDEIEEIIESCENEYDPLEDDPFDDEYEEEEEEEPIIE